jgi:transcription elongation factor Elf1
MNETNLINKLSSFKDKKKFELLEWNDRGLNPSENDVINEMKKIIDTFLSELINALKIDSSNFKNDFLFLLNTVDLENYDTEEKEFILDYLAETSKICELKISNQLNELLYGKTIVDLLVETETKETKPENFVQSFKMDEPCQVCNKPLKSLAIEKKEQKEYIGIAECFNCKKLTIIHFPNELEIIDIYNYRVIEKILYSKENECKLIDKIKTAHNNS